MSVGNKNFKEDRRRTLSEAIINGMPESRANRRCRGQTTAIALNTIAMAMLRPGEIVEIQDHADTEFARKELTRTIAAILDNLQLVGFSLTRKTLTYTLDYIYANR